MGNHVDKILELLGFVHEPIGVELRLIFDDDDECLVRIRGCLIGSDFVMLETDYCYFGNMLFNILIRSIILENNGYEDPKHGWIAITSPSKPSQKCQILAIKEVKILP